jgi:hypothetical protein
VLPVIAIYTATVYWLFRGKLHEGGVAITSNTGSSSANVGGSMKKELFIIAAALVVAGAAAAGAL